jgi:translation initiation factor 6 (eIF-6)
MNSQFKIFAEMAGYYVSDEGIIYSNDRTGIQNDELEKFGNFIITQCISSCRTVGTMAELTNDGEMARKTKATAESCEKLIKQYFGMTNEH